jgi:SAM-dependent methyltransferase
VRFDATGKVSLDHIYTQPDPRAYFGTLRELGYCIPQLAKPHFAALIEECRAWRGTAEPRVLDLGSSYGINAALLRCDVTMDDLYSRYGAIAQDAPTGEVVAVDRELVRAGRGVRARYLGLDISRPALSYATAAGFLDDAVLADLESGELTGSQRRQLAGVDLVVSTGCLGYVGAATIGKIVAACGDRLPWMAHFVLRMFPFDEIAATLARAGYDTVRLDRVFRQRTFVSPEEQAQVLDTLASVGVDPAGHETDGWFYAQLYVSRPRGGPAPSIFGLPSNTAVGSPADRTDHRSRG